MNNENILQDDDPDEDPEVRRRAALKKSLLHHWKQRHDRWLREQEASTGERQE